MPAIASLEELNMVRRDFRSMFLAATPNDLHLTPYGKKDWMRFLKGKISERIQQRPSDLLGAIRLGEVDDSILSGQG